MTSGNRNTRIIETKDTNRNTDVDLERKAVQIPELRSKISGRVIAPGEEGYDDRRTLFYGGHDHRPAVIIQPANASDIVRAIALAKENGLELSIRSGGHSTPGHSVTDGGVMIDLNLMKNLEIDPERRTAEAETGLTAGEYTLAAGEYGLATGFGDTGSVGIGGITLGGGIGFLVRKYGMTIDNLLGAEIVTSNGEILWVDEKNHPDLFWAIRGGGGNFGAATRFKFRLAPVDQVLGGMLILPATPDVITGFIEAADAAPEELSTILNVMSAPPMPFLPPEVHGKIIAMAMMVYAGNVEEGQRVIAPFRALAQPLADMLRPMKYPEMYIEEEGDYHPTAVGRTIFVDSVDHSAAEAIVHYLETSNAPMRVAQLRVLGGAMSRMPDDATAFAHRQRKFMVGTYAFYDGQGDRQEKEAWAYKLSAAIQRGKPGAYVNFLDNEGDARVREAYPGGTWERLVEIKRRYDPENLFRLNQNIPPSR